MHTTDGVLGIWDGHDASVALAVDGRLAFALSEERPTRQKRFSGFPAEALTEALAFAEAAGVRVTDVAVAGAHGRAHLRLLAPLYEGSDPHRDPLSVPSALVRGWENVVARVPGLRAVERLAGLAPLLARLAGRLGGLPRVHTVPHHEAHAWSALLAGPRRGALVVTWDAYGEGVAATFRLADTPEVAATLPVSAGLASLYGAVTVALGFREGDEGKVMGLAASGHEETARERFRALFTGPAEAPRWTRALTRRRMELLLRGLSREDAAAGLQAVTVELLTRAVAHRLAAYGRERRLLLAGGLFANVRVNQALAALPGVTGVSVFPNMGDGGLSAGAAHRVHYLRTGRFLAPLSDAYLGSAFSGERAERAVTSAGLGTRRVAEPALEAARHLRAGRPVAIVRGRDEFGPRALGNRSLLFPADVPGLADRVNRMLGRDGFMPFAPALREEELDLLAPGLVADELATMTRAVDAHPDFRAACPEAVHVDGTARPQVVTAATAPRFHAILTAYRALGGPPAVVNTSFNLHGEPIVHTPEDAVATLVRAGLAHLFLDDLEVEGPS